MTDIAELFARNPLKLTRPDVNAIIDQLRKSRHAFNLGNTKAGSTKAPTAKQKELKSIADGVDFNL